MVLATLLHIMNMLVWSVQFFTGLILGLSLVGINVRKLLTKLIGLSISFGVVYSLSVLFLPTKVVWTSLFIILFIIFMKWLKIPVTQITVSILLALIFHILIIFLLEYNIFELLLDMANVSMDVGTKLSIDMFAMLTNIFICMLIVSKLPVLFPKNLFEKSLHTDDPEISFSSQVYSVIIILSLLVVGLFFTLLELTHIRLHYRLFLTFWLLAITFAIILFQRKIIIFKNERVQLFLDQQYQKELLSFFNIIRSQRHDFNFHLTAMHGLIQKKEYEACEKYIEEMVESATNINDLLPLHHTATAAMLNTLKEKATAKGISIEFIITNDLRNCPCSVYEINKVIGNLLQNAIDEVSQHDAKQKPIVVEIGKQRNQLLISVTNDVQIDDTRLDRLFEIGFSTKHDHDGLGLPIVRKIVDKYRGSIYPLLDGHRITIQVLIPELLH